jgi:hypothetical protein
MNKIKRSIKLLRAAFAVLLREKKLLLFPLIGTAMAVGAALFFLAPIVLYPSGHSYFSAAHWQVLCDRLTQGMGSAPGRPAGVGLHTGPALLASHWWLTPFFAVTYFVSMFLATFCNVAFYHEIMQALNGRPVSLRRGFAFASARWRAVLLWSLFAGLVGYLINTLEQRLGFVGQMVCGLIGLAWSAACIFIIPTLVRDEETANPLVLLRHSAATLRRTWGELIVGFVGLEMVFGAIFMGLMGMAVLAGVGIYALGLHSGWLLLGLVLAGVGIFLAAAVVLSWLSGLVNPIYRCALYIYATEGVVPGTFDQELLDSAWKVK